VTAIGKLFALLVLLFLAAVLFSQEPYKPNEIQSLQLQVLQRDAIIAQKDLNAAQAAYQKALTALTDKGNEVKKANKWPDNVQFDPNTLNFSAPSKPKETEKK
jgi:hypothetical protein